jgi:hypothetical protein
MWRSSVHASSVFYRRPRHVRGLDLDCQGVGVRSEKCRIGLQVRYSEFLITQICSHCLSAYRWCLTFFAHKTIFSIIADLGQVVRRDNKEVQKFCRKSQVWRFSCVPLTAENGGKAAGEMGLCQPHLHSKQITELNSQPSSSYRKWISVISRVELRQCPAAMSLHCLQKGY